MNKDEGEVVALRTLKGPDTTGWHLAATLDGRRDHVSESCSINADTKQEQSRVFLSRTDGKTNKWLMVNLLVGLWNIEGELSHEIQCKWIYL